MTTGKKDAKSSVLPVNPTNSVAFHEALHGLLALTQLLGSLPVAEGEGGGSPTIILTSAGIEVRMSEPAPSRNAESAVSAAQFQKIEECLESVRQATAALSAAFCESVKNVDQTLASHTAAIDSVRAALTQNEQLMESMVELMGPSDFTLPQTGEFANIS